MFRERMSLRIARKVGHSHRGFCSAALAIAVAGLLLETTLALAAEGPSSRVTLLIGTATADITPKLPVALTGFQTARTTRTIQSPLTVNVLALESRQGERTTDLAILVSCDLCVIRPGIQEQFRKQAAALSLACPAQMSQGETVVSADFWHYARERLRQRCGEDLCVLGFCAPAGDQCPHLSYRKKSEARMDQLRGLSRTEELGRRIAQAFFDVADVMAKDIRTDVPLVHLVRQVDLPQRIVTEAEYAIAKKVCADIDAKSEPGGWDTWVRRLYGGVHDRYVAQQQGDRNYPMELHVLRLGDVAIATNPFELYLDYGVQIEARSPAEQTFLIQLASPSENAYYVPTPRAVTGGRFSETVMDNYSATVMTNIVGPEGAQVLVDRTVEAIGELWKSPAGASAAASR